jgi:hypothetical protein
MRRLLLGNHGQFANNSVSSFDADALNYILRVEAADGQTLENGVRVLINTFVVGCKTDNIWNAIKASCILAGARTLSGALVPLVGTAPTNFNFVSGDYNRNTGLVGNGSTKYLDSNRADNVDPQNSKHLSIYASTLGPFFIGELVSNRTSLTLNVGNLNIGTRINSTDGTIGPSAAAGFLGGSRISASTITWRSGNSSSNATNTSQSGATGNLMIFRTQGGYSNNRLAFYSIGESLDLALLDARVSTLINHYKFFLYTAANPLDYDPDTVLYVNRAYDAGGTLA